MVITFLPSNLTYSAQKHLFHMSKFPKMTNQKVCNMTPAAGMLQGLVNWTWSERMTRRRQLTSWYRIGKCMRITTPRHSLMISPF